ncbi:hypothetical protein ACLK1T_10295 [Escherichia coli]
MTANLLPASVPVKASSVLMRALSKRSAVAWRMRHMLTGLSETSTPDLELARRFAQAFHAKYPGKLLAYNCSPSFNWQKTLDDKNYCQLPAAAVGYGLRFQFITLAGIHSMWFD